MKDFKNKKQQLDVSHKNAQVFPPHPRGRVREGGKYKAAFTLAEGGRRPLLNSGNRRAAFTLAEVLITLAIIGIVAVLTIPALVKNHQEKAWSTAQDVFSKKFEVALKSMTTNSTVSGYDSTESFVNELKKYIKITNICTGDVTKCFAPKVVWTPNEEAVEVTNKAVKYNESTGDWAETVGIQFANGVNALISYNKQCYVDPYNNQEAIMAKCVGMIYDVSGFKTPNTNGKDILANANVTALAGEAGCAYKLSDGTCLTKILKAGTDYAGLSYDECMQAKNDNKIDVKYCYNGETPGDEITDGKDYYAGAVLACDGKTANLPSAEQLKKLAQELYNTETINDWRTTGLTLDKTKAAPFLAYGSRFRIWSNQENSVYSRYWEFADTWTEFPYPAPGASDLRGSRNQLAVCMDNSK